MIGIAWIGAALNILLILILDAREVTVVRFSRSDMEIRESVQKSTL